jgi:hypothetical protein
MNIETEAYSPKYNIDSSVWSKTTVLKVLQTDDTIWEYLSWSVLKNYKYTYSETPI